MVNFFWSKPNATWADSQSFSQLSERVVVTFSSSWAFKNINIFHNLTKAQVPKGSWGRKDGRRPAVTQKANERRE